MSHYMLLCIYMYLHVLMGINVKVREYRKGDQKRTIQSN